MPEGQYQAVLAFNYYPSQSLHSSWWPSLLTRANKHTTQEQDEAIVNALTPEQVIALNNRQAGLVSAWLLKAFELDGQFDFDFDSPEKQLLLQSPPQLQTLCNYLTALLYHTFIASLLQANKVRAIKGLLGEDAYGFAVKQAPLLLNQIPEFLQKHMVAPEELDFTDTEKLAGQLHLAAYALLKGSAGQFTPAQQWRLHWKLPYSDSQAAPISGPEVQNSNAEQHKICRQLIKKVSKQLSRVNLA